MVLRHKKQYQIDSLICGNVGIVRTEKVFVVIAEDDIMGPFANEDMPKIREILNNPKGDFSKMKFKKVNSWG